MSRVLAGRKVTSIEVLERVADGCQMPSDARTELGLAPQMSTRSIAGVPTADPAAVRTQSWREDLGGVATLWDCEPNRRNPSRLAFSAAGYMTPALRWFAAGDAGPLDQAGRRAIGQPDVDTIREMTARSASWTTISAVGMRATTSPDTSLRMWRHC